MKMQIPATMRLRLAGALMAGVISVLGVAQAHAATPTIQTYTCGAYQNLTVQREARTARVNIAEHTYVLYRKSSSVGEKYASSTAALIVDGPSAVFVSEQHWRLGACQEILPGAGR